MTTHGEAGWSVETVYAAGEPVDDRVVFLCACGASFETPDALLAHVRIAERTARAYPTVVSP